MKGREKRKRGGKRKPDSSKVEQLPQSKENTKVHQEGSTRWSRAVNVYQDNVEVLFSLHKAYLEKKHTTFVFRTFICALSVTILKINVSVGN